MRRDEPILIATRSAGKMRELRTLFRDAGRAILSLDEAGLPEDPAEEALETADTFEENARLKARYFHARSGRPTVADDSGIEILALAGAPGVRSKRWSGQPDLTGQALDDANNALLLARLAGVTDRRARYVCAAAYHDGALDIVERGMVDGRITDAAQGSNGFGYDPFFESTELGATFGAVSAEAKARVSHRARAFAKLLQRLESPTFG
jgi:XTP/dITP diphosphohydrolase